MNALPNPFENFNSADKADTAAVAVCTAPASVAAAVLISESVQCPVERQAASTNAAGGKTMPPAPFSDEDLIPELVQNATRYAPEYFSDYAYRRSMATVSPNHGRSESREFEPDFDAMYDYIVPPEPPLCLQGPPYIPADRPSLRNLVLTLLRVGEAA